MVKQCKEVTCRYKTNLLRSAGWLPANRHAPLSLQKLDAAILQYTASNAKTPPPSACTVGKAIGSTWEPGSRALQPLLELEREAGQCLNETMRLEKHVELDGTTVRTCRISPRSTRCLDHTKFTRALQVRRRNQERSIKSVLQFTRRNSKRKSRASYMLQVRRSS